MIKQGVGSPNLNLVGAANIFPSRPHETAAGEEGGIVMFWRTWSLG